jgi:predicted transcriptional regulator
LMIRSIVGFGAPIIESDPIIGSIVVSPIIELIVLSVCIHTHHSQYMRDHEIGYEI